MTEYILAVQTLTILALCAALLIREKTTKLLRKQIADSEMKRAYVNLLREVTAGNELVQLVQRVQRVQELAQATRLSRIRAYCHDGMEGQEEPFDGNSQACHDILKILDHQGEAPS